MRRYDSNLENAVLGDWLDWPSRQISAARTRSWDELECVILLHFFVTAVAIHKFQWKVQAPLQFGALWRALNHACHRSQLRERQMGLDREEIDNRGRALGYRSDFRLLDYVSIYNSAYFFRDFVSRCHKYDLGFETKQRQDRARPSSIVNYVADNGGQSERF